MSGSSSSSVSPQTPGAWRRLRRWTLLYAVTPYCSLLLLMFLFQRSLMYHPQTADAIHPADARLPSGQVHAVTTTTADGLTLCGWHLLRDGRAADSRADCDRHLATGGPVVLYFPGNALNRSRRAGDCRDFTGLGADVFLFDYRGYGENPGSPSETGLALDARAAWTHVTAERDVEPRRILLFGESLGGAVAVRLCSELCEAGTPPAGLILTSTFSSMADAAAAHYPWFPVRMLLLDEYLSAERIGGVTCPLLQFHGRRDRIVPFELGKKLFEAAPDESANGISKRFVALPAAGHNNIPRRAFREAVGEFLRSLRKTASPAIQPSRQR